MSAIMAEYNTIEPQYKTTNEIGELLKKEYGSPTDPNKHIDYFYLRVPEAEAAIAAKIIPDVKKELGDEFCALVDKNWPGFILIRFPIIKGENENEREKKLDKTIRYPMANKEITMMTFSRACLYHNYELAQDTVSTNDIEQILNPHLNTVQQLQKDPHQDFFYLTVRIKNDGKEADIHSVLKTLPGGWRIVEPQDTWPKTFFGYFPRSPFDKSEREREARLTREVRFPLMKALEEKLAITYPKEGETFQRKVLILLTRACKLKTANNGNKFEIETRENDQNS